MTQTHLALLLCFPVWSVPSGFVTARYLGVTVFVSSTADENEIYNPSEGQTVRNDTSASFFCHFILANIVSDKMSLRKIRHLQAQNMGMGYQMYNCGI
jgi:hypothetical protein